jgi:hypothetical protein
MSVGAPPRYYSIFNEEKKAFINTQIDWWKFGDGVQIGDLLIKVSGQYLNHERGLNSHTNILTLDPKWGKDQISTVILILF